MSVSIALSGDNYYICGPRGNNIVGCTDRSFRKIFHHPSRPSVHHTYVAVGENASYYIKFYDEVTRRTLGAYSLEGYEGLSEMLVADDSLAAFVSLGSDGYYFARMENGTRYWRLPDEADDFVESASKTDPVDKVWLGVDGSYVAQKRSGAVRQNLGGNYSGLGNAIRYSPVRIKSLGLNLENHRSWWVIFEDGQLAGNPTATRLTKDVFKEWIGRYADM